MRKRTASRSIYLSATSCCSGGFSRCHILQRQVRHFGYNEVQEGFQSSLDWQGEYMNMSIASPFIEGAEEDGPKGLIPFLSLVALA